MVEIKGSNGLKVSEKSIHVFFADSREELNRKLDWVTDNNFNDMDTDAIEAMKELSGLSEGSIKEIVSKIIYSCKVIGVAEKFNEEEFFKKYGHENIREIA